MQSGPAGRSRNLGAVLVLELGTGFLELEFLELVLELGTKFLELGACELFSRRLHPTIVCTATRMGLDGVASPKAWK